MNRETCAIDPQQHALLLAAAEWRMMGLLFEYPSPGWRQRVSVLSGNVTDPRLQQAAQAAHQEASEGMHHSLFGPGGPVPAREVSYVSSIQPGYLLSELAAYYEAFGYNPGIQETADHISVEAGFVAYLCLKEAYALASGDQDQVELTAQAVQQFKQDHLSAVAYPLLKALEAHAPPYLVLAGEAMFERLGSPKRASANPLMGITADDPDAGVNCASSVPPDVCLVPLDANE